MAGRLDGRVALVTGAAQGIGAAYAQAMAREGATVVISDVIDTSAIVDTLKGQGLKASGVHCDVTDPASVKAMVDGAIAAHGRIDILVNNAALFGKLALKSFLEIDSGEFDKVLAVNVRGSFECAKAVAPQMMKQKYGKIINVASGTVFKGTPMLMHYVTSKGAVVALTRCLSRELGDSGVRVNAIAPGLVVSEAVVANPAWKDELIAANSATRCIKREAEPDDMVGTMIYLCSAESDFMTGQTLVVDGGSVMH